MIQNIGGLIRPFRDIGVKRRRASERLSTGRKINRAADDAAGLAISEGMEAQIRGLEKADKNIQDGVSLIQTADGALANIHEILNRMAELTVQAANDIHTTQDREKLQKEIDELTEEIDNIANNTSFNGLLLLDGSLGNGGGAKFYNTLSNIKGVTYKPKVSQGESWKGSIDLSQIRDGATLNINDTVFEFDSDGVVNNTGAASISFSYGSAMSDLKNSIEAAIQSNLPAEKLDLFNCSLGQGSNLDIELKAANRDTNGEEYSVSMEYPIPDITIGDVNIKSTPGTVVGTSGIRRSIEIKDIDLNELVDGSTLEINGIVYEIDTDGTVQSGHTAIDLSNRVNQMNDINAVIRKDWRDSPNNICSVVGFYKNGNKWVFRMTYQGFGTEESQPLNVKFNSDIEKDLSSAITVTDSQKSKYTPEVQLQQANRKESIDFSVIEDGYIFNINGKSFEFDSDGNTDSANIAVDISSLNDADDIAQAFKNTFNASNAAVDYSITVSSVGDGKNIVNIISNPNSTTDGQEISISYRNADGSLDVGLNFQVGSNAGQYLHLCIDSATTSYLGIDALNVLSNADSESCLEKIYNAIDLISDNRTNLGAAQNRLEFIQNSTQISSENLSAAKSRIMDADMAKEMMCLIEQNILEQAAQGILVINQNLTRQTVSRLLQSS